MKRFFPSVLFLFGTVLIWGCSHPDETGARQTVEAFAKNEFEGNYSNVRERLVTFSPELEAEFQKLKHPWLAKHEHAPQIVAVDTYEVKDVRVEGDRATAVVAYRRLARTEKFWEAPYIVDRKDNDLVTLNLVFDAGWRPPTWNISYVTAVWNYFFTKDQWWIIDPPPQRVSKQVLVKNSEWTIKHRGLENHPEWQRERDNIKLLKSL